ncbi:MAG TPA: phage tail tape measure protein, partial [Polyangia bacterium]|nr:phage tail tape measure protein [Polyangia bacterium]
MPFDFSQFEREAGKLLSDLKGSVDRIGALEKDLRAGRAGPAQAEAAISEGRVSGGVVSSGATSEAEIRARGASIDELTARQRALNVAETESIQAERTMAQVMATNATATRNAGALTNEFVDAAKRGEVTVRDLGAQMSGTIAKFGGWLTAGAAVYFAFDALSALKRGAIDATSGVTQMQRVIDNLDVSSATKEVRELAAEFNLPINTVTETAFDVGKAYHNQAEALEATKAALYAVKVGELDTGTASKYLISIIQGFHLPASQTITLFDQLLVAQKRYAIELPSLMAGVARAAGSYRAAGGDIHSLIALITTLQHVSGQQGNVIGTAIQRSPHFYQSPKGESILRSFGVDPTQDIESVYNEAILAAHGKSGRVQREIAEGLFGPQYASRIGIFLLQNKELYEEVYSTTSKKHAKGAAGEQLQIVLSQSKERITEIGTSLERLGSILAEGHFLDSLGLALKLLDDTLRIVNEVGEAFNSLPDGLQQALAYLVQFSLLLKTMRRLNVGETIAGTEPGAARGAAARFLGYQSPTAYAKLTREAFINEEKALLGEQSRLGGQLYRGQRRQTLAIGGVQAANDEYGRAVGLYGEGSKEALAAQQKVTAAEADLAATKQRQYSLALDEQAATERLAAVQASIARTRKTVIGGLDAEATVAEAERLNYPVPAKFARGGTERPIMLGAANLESWQQDELNAVKAMEERGLIAGGAAEAAAVGTSGATTRLTSLGGKFGSLSGGLGRMGGAMSTLLGRAGELAFAAFTIGFLSEQLVSLADNVSNEFEEITHSTANSAKERLDRLERLKETSTDGTNFSQRVSEVVNERTNVGPVSVPTLGLGKAFGLNVNKSANEEEAEIEEQEIRNIQLERQTQRKAQREGKPVPFRYIPEIVKDIERVKNSNRSRGEINAELDKYEQELLHSSYSPHHNAELKKAQQLLHESTVETSSNKNLVESLQVLQSKDIEQRLQADVKLIGGGAAQAINPEYSKKAALTYQALAQKFGTTENAKELGELISEREQLLQGIESSINNELAFSLQFAHSPKARNAAYAAAFRQYRAFAGSTSQAVNQQQEVVAGIEAKLHQAATFVGPPSPAQTKATDALRKQLDVEKEKLEKVQEQQGATQRFLKAAYQKLREQQYQANSALRQAQEQATEALTADPIRQAEEKIAFIGREVSSAIRIYGRDSTQVLQLITEQRQAQQQLIQNQLGILQAQSGLETAGIIQQVPKEQATLNGANGLKAQLAFAEAHSKDFDPKQIIELQAQVRSAEAQLAYDIIQEATQLADARFGIREARAQAAGHTVQAASIAVKKAEYDLAHAQTPVEKLNAQQALVQALGTKRQEAAQARIASITFEANIAKISTSEEISQLETLLHTYKLSLTARRQLREQIHSLKGQLASEGEGFNLNVGDFSLPTAYDIRRAVLAGGGGKATVNQTNHFNIESHGADAKDIGREVFNALG